MSKNDNKMTNPKIVAVSGGFYFFGDEVQGQEGFLTLERAAMFGGFGGGKGVAGVARGATDATVKLDRFDPEEKTVFPMSAVFAILPSINLYEFKGTTLR